MALRKDDTHKSRNGTIFFSLLRAFFFLIWRWKMTSWLDTFFATKFTSKLRSLGSAEFPANVGLGTHPCTKNQTYQGPYGTMFAPSVYSVIGNANHSSSPSTSFWSIKGCLHLIFQSVHLLFLTTLETHQTIPWREKGTKLSVLPFNTTLEFIMQDTSMNGAESHPLHLHDFNFTQSNPFKYILLS